MSLYESNWLDDDCFKKRFGNINRLFKDSLENNFLSNSSLGYLGFKESMSLKCLI